MRDDSYLQRESDAAEAKASAWRGRAATTAGALISLALLAIVVVWSYRLGVRDANDVPVIRSQTDATKVRPEEPGGIEIAHQGREVYNIVNGTETTGDGAFAPSEEVLTAEDAPVSPAPEPRPAEITETVEVAPAPAPAPEEPLRTEPVASEDVAAAEAEAEADAEAGEDDVSALAPTSAPIAVSRPARSAAAPPEAAEEAEPRAAALASRIQIQLGAFNSQEIAAQQWVDLKNRNGDLLSGRGRVVTPVVSGGKRLYRLRAGPFANVDEASTLCRALKARDEDCIVARAK